MARTTRLEGARHRGWRNLRSLVSAGLALAMVLAAAPAATAQQASPPSSTATWFAPYVDTTLPPMYQIQDHSANPAHQSVLGFIVAANPSSCTPSWGTYYSLSGAAGAPLSLSTVVSAMHAEGETPIVSFGGEANSPLADACSSVGALEAAYASVISRYGLSVLDFDIEGAAQGDTAALVRQAQAIRLLQAAAAGRGKTLGVWLTLPVTTGGMLPVASKVVDIMLDGGVKLSGVNLMTMYFSPSPGDGAPMLAAVESALRSSHSQLAQIFAAHGIGLSSSGVWAHMGATVQIGQAGIPDQAFSVADAKGLVGFANTVGLGRISDWSINQDFPCGSASHPSVGGYSNYCSGVVQSPLAFDKAFSALGGTATSTPLVGAKITSPTTPGTSTTTGATTTTTTVPATTTGATTTTTPPPTTTTTTTAAATGSYAPWSASVAYPAGRTVSLGGTIYRAKWWNRGQRPNAAVAHPWDTPWQQIGTVPPGAPATTTATLAPGTYPLWSPSRTYVAGDRVLFAGRPYQAKWWDRGSSPSAEASHPYSSPWKPLFAVPGSPG